LLAYIAGGSTGSTGVTTLTAPAGWNLVLRTDHGTTGLFAVYAKIATASEPVSYTFTAVSTPAGGILYTSWMLAFGGTNTANPIDVALGADVSPVTSATSFSAPPIVTTGSKEEVIESFSGHTYVTVSPGAWTAPGGVTEAVIIDNAQARSGASYYRSVPTAGSVPGTTVTVSLAQDIAIANAIALRPCQ
jgi:hypothetical protein